jgi:adenosylcobinamide-GDP ribazoletransferase
MKFVAGIAASLVSFTRIPFPLKLSEAAFQKASWHLPLIGWLWVWLCSLVLRFDSFTDDGLVFFCLVLPILLSGAMHEDGLADAADGLIGGQNREKRLEIMKDPRVGSYGVISIVLVLLGQFLAIRAIEPSYRLAALAFVLPVSRCIAAILLQILPYARTENSRASAYVSRSFAGILWPIFWTVPALSFVAVNQRLPLLAVSFCLLLGFAFYFWKKLGGVTGDCLGAAVKLSEISLLWCFTAILPAA